MSASHEQEQSGHGREVDPADIEFEMWWDRDSGWGGERLAEYQLAREAFKFGMRIAELESREQWVPPEEVPKNYRGWCWIEYKGKMRHAYIADEMYLLTQHSHNCYLTECIKRVQLLPTPPNHTKGDRDG